MSKIDFLKKYNNICSELGLQLDPRVEYGLKISKSNINTDKINISVRKGEITKDNFIYIVENLFDYPDKAISFINNAFKKHNEDIQHMYVGYSNGFKEVYFEIYAPGESSYVLSYDENEDKVSEYFADDLIDIIKEVSDLVKTETQIILPEYIFKGGCIKNNSIYYLLILEPLSSMSSILKTLCQKLYLDHYNEFEKWIDSYDGYQISNLGYTKINNEVFLNIYVTKIINDGTTTN